MTIGFHCQPAAEKLIKALISSAGGEFRKTHDLNALINSLCGLGETLPPQFDMLDALTPFGSLYRYEDYDSMITFDRTRLGIGFDHLRAWCERRAGASALL